MYVVIWKIIYESHKHLKHVITYIYITVLSTQANNE